MSWLLQGFLLGLANGASCLATCAPVLLPFFLGEGLSIRRSVVLVLQFLAGRLAGYLVFAVVVWEAGSKIRSGARGEAVFGAIFAILAILLIVYGFSSPANPCAAGGMVKRFPSVLRRYPSLLPGAMGLLTGLSLCPPFLAALAGATREVSLASSLLFFLAFFFATSLYLIPFPFAGKLGRTVAVRTTGRLAAGIMGCYFLYKGLIMIYGGLRL